MKIRAIFLKFVCVLTLISAPTILTAAETSKPKGEVRRTASKMVSNTFVYSIRFPGGKASDFFAFLRTNGFGEDSVLFARRADHVYIPAFTLNNVRLKEVGKSLEMLTEDQLAVELVEAGEASDVNIWRVKFPVSESLIKTKACGMPFLLRDKKGQQRVSEIAHTVERILLDQMEREGRSGNRVIRGNARILDQEKIVVIVGSDSYVEAIAAALEKAEEVAAVEAANSKPR